MKELNLGIFEEAPDKIILKFPTPTIYKPIGDNKIEKRCAYLELSLVRDNNLGASYRSELKKTDEYKIFGEYEIIKEIELDKFTELATKLGGPLAAQQLVNQSYDETSVYYSSDNFKPKKIFLKKIG